MIRLFRKSCLMALSLLLSAGAVSSSLMARECCDVSECSRFYVGAFGGGLFSNSTNLYQMGTVFFAEANGGPLAVYAHGKAKSTSSGFGGLQLGQEWSHLPYSLCCSGWNIRPAVELEAYWYSHTKRGELLNETERLVEGSFSDAFHINSGVYLANVVISLNNSCCGSFIPYVGGGIGASRISIRNAASQQTDPLESDINHFNSLRHDSSWAFAAQAKAGIRYNICQSLSVFGEYRFLFVDASNYIFGSTVYSTHVPTSPWNVKISNTKYNAFVLGLRYDL